MVEIKKIIWEGRGLGAFMWWSMLIILLQTPWAWVFQKWELVFFFFAELILWKFYLCLEDVNGKGDRIMKNSVSNLAKDDSFNANGFLETPVYEACRSRLGIIERV